MPGGLEGALEVPSGDAPIEQVAAFLLVVGQILAADWRRLDERIATVSADIESLAEQDGRYERLPLLMLWTALPTGA